MSVTITLKNVRLSFPSLTEKTGFGDSAQKYEATFLFPKTDKATKKLIDDAVQEIKDEMFKGKLSDKDVYTYTDGDDKEYDGYEGMWSIKARNGKKRPILYDKKASDGQISIDDANDLFYAGCYVNAQITLYGYNSPVSKGIACNLDGVQFKRDGEEFGGTKVQFEDEEEEEF